MAKEKEKKEKVEGAEKAPKAEKAEKKVKKPAAAAAPAAAVAAEPAAKPPVPRLKERYRQEILPALMKEAGYKNPMAVPKLKKIVLNMGLGEASRNIKVLDYAQDELSRITGQKPVIRKARKAISSFKLRENMPIGCSVTL